MLIKGIFIFFSSFVKLFLSRCILLYDLIIHMVQVDLHWWMRLIVIKHMNYNFQMLLLCVMITSILCLSWCSYTMKHSLLYGAEDPSIAGMVLDSAFSNLFGLMMELVDVYKIRLPKFTVCILSSEIVRFLVVILCWINTVICLYNRCVWHWGRLAKAGCAFGPFISV